MADFKETPAVTWQSELVESDRRRFGNLYQSLNTAPDPALWHPDRHLQAITGNVNQH